MTPDRWRRIEDIYRTVVDRPASERPALLDALCAGDDALREDVAALLESADTPEGFIDAVVGGVLNQVVASQASASLEGRRIGPYVVGPLLGAGGMGEVYRAHDERLGREVAIKVLPPLFVADADRVARFEREARLLAALSHPGIGVIYGMEDLDGVSALVLELVDGPTLAERLKGRAMPVPEALALAVAIAEAIEAAHEKGIVHRDLKPSNIKLPSGGGVKVLDFGIATMSPRSADAAAAPADRSAATVLLGTGAYLSPEQIRGDAIDERTDVWAFGCVLYELLTGRRPFAAGTTAETIAAILEREPDWDRLPDALPASVRRLLRRCLQKESRQRLRAIGDARIELQEALGSVGASDAAPPRPRRRGWKVAAWAAVMLLALGTAAATSLTWWRRAEPPRVPVARFAVSVPAGERLAPAPAIALSPDGERLAFVAVRDGIPRLYLRSLGEIEPAPVPGSEGADQPFFSHDGQWIAFFAERQLKKAPVVGGVSVAVCDVAVPRGGTWLPDDTIVVGDLQRRPVSRSRRRRRACPTDPASRGRGQPPMAARDPRR